MSSPGLQYDSDKMMVAPLVNVIKVVYLMPDTVQMLRSPYFTQPSKQLS